MANSNWRHDGEADAARGRRLDMMFRDGHHGALIEELRSDITTALRRVGGLTDEQREDLAQDTIVYLLAEWKRGRTYGGNCIVSVARQRARWMALDFFKAANEPRRRGFKAVPLDYSFPTHDSNGDESASVVEPLEPGPGPYDLAAEADFEEMILDVLPPREREVFRLRCFEGLGSYEVAERLGCEPNAVDQAYHRAKRRLRDEGLNL